MAIPLLKALSSHHPYVNPSFVLLDAGYDFNPIYQQAQNIGARALIDVMRDIRQEITDGKL